MNLCKICFVIAAVAGTMPTLASTLDVSFTGAVSDALGTTANSGYADGAVISGSFLINTTNDAVTGATLGTYVAPPSSGMNPSPAASLSATDAIYTQGLFASAGDPVNKSITVDFSALNSFTGSDPVAFLEQGATALAQQIDFTGAASMFPSTATYYSATASGNNVTEVAVYLTGVSVTTVPLPGAAWLFAPIAAALLFMPRRRFA